MIPSNGERVERGLCLLSALLMLALTAIPIYLIPHHVPLNYNEGWNAYFARAAAHGEALYPPSQSYLTNNYPPLSFLVVGLLGTVFDDDVVAGRILSVTSFVLLGAAIFQLNRWLGARRGLALLGALQTMLAIYCLRPGAMAMDDPQFLAQFLVVAGAVVLVGQIGAETAGALVLSAVLIVAGGLVKHNVISLPFALSLWLLLKHRSTAVRFLPVLAAVGATAVAVLAAIWGHRVFDSVLHHERVISTPLALARAQSLAPFALPYYAIAAYAWIRLSDRPAAVLLAVYAGVSTAVGFWMLSGIGVVLNVLYDAVIALGLGTTAFVLCLEQDLPGRSKNAAVLATAKAALLVPIVAFAILVQRETTARDLDLLAREKDWARLIVRLSQSDEPVACETLSLCFWAGKPAAIDFFNFGSKLRTGAMTDADFRARIERGEYGYIQIEPGSTRLPTSTADWLAAHYVIVDGIENRSLLLSPRNR